MATPSLNFCRREGKGKTRFAQTVPLPFSSLQQKFKAPSRHNVKGQRRKTKANPSRGWPCRLGGRPDGLAFFPALCGALDFCCEEEKERRLSERSEFASSPSSQQKSKEGVAASGAPFFAYFLWQDKESESTPAGDETGDAPPTNNQTHPINPNQGLPNNSRSPPAGHCATSRCSGFGPCSLRT